MKLRVAICRDLRWMGGLGGVSFFLAGGHVITAPPRAWTIADVSLALARGPPFCKSSGAEWSQVSSELSLNPITRLLKIGDPSSLGHLWAAGSTFIVSVRLRPAPDSCPLPRVVSHNPPGTGSPPPPQDEGLLISCGWMNIKHHPVNVSFTSLEIAKPWSSRDVNWVNKHP